MITRAAGTDYGIACTIPGLISRTAYETLVFGASRASRSIPLREFT